MDDKPQGLLEKARQVAQHAYAPYSRFAVGAAVETSEGHIFTAANMENASYGLTICAEVGALQAASSAGQLHKIKRMAVVGGPIDPAADYNAQATAPCGRCRQLISEAAMLAGSDIAIWFGDLSGSQVKRTSIAALLPDAFCAKNLK